MVRFIIIALRNRLRVLARIYIPIWLDLLFPLFFKPQFANPDLHSNMVRFIIITSPGIKSSEYTFTFQYGQIYYDAGGADLIKANYYLHSNMVRFIMIGVNRFRCYVYQFTFQYGQIYYACGLSRLGKRDRIYIPIWLDLLSCSELQFFFCFEHLHSNMVRFIIGNQAGEGVGDMSFTFQYGQIYYYNRFRR